MGISSLIRKFENRRTLKRARERDNIASQLSVLKEKRSIIEGKKKIREAKEYNRSNSFIGRVGEELKKAQSNKKRIGVLFGSGKKKEAENRFSNKGVFYEGK